MKNQNNILRRISSFILIFALVFAIVPTGDLSYANGLSVEVESVEKLAGLKVIGYEDEEILDLTGLEFEENETALDFSKRILDEKNIEYDASGGYFSSINGLSAFDKGEYSGWMVRVNGELPDVGLGDIKLKDGDLVELFYLENYNSLFAKGKGQLIVKGFEEEKILITDFIEFEEDETALDFSKRILDDNKIEYDASGGYFSSINGLSAFDKGPKSGWMAKINGKLPDVGLGDIKVDDGIVIKLFYVEDYETIFPPIDGNADELFTDMDGYGWAKEAVESLAIDGLLEGTGNNKFSPEKNVTRAEFAAMITRLLGLEDVGPNKFKDINEGDWFYKDVLKLSNKGYIKGRPGGNFDPSGRITREEIVTIVGKILNDQDIKLEDKDAIKKFKDYRKISDWAIDGASLTVQEEIIYGIEGSFMPSKNASRAEAATILFRLRESSK